MDTNYLIQKETLVGLADALRTLAGSIDSLTAAEMQPIVKEANEIIGEIQMALSARHFVAYDTCTVTVTDNTGYGTGCTIAAYCLGVDDSGNIRFMRKEGSGAEGEMSYSFTALRGSFIFVEHVSEPWWLDSVSVSDGATVSRMRGNPNVFVVALDPDVSGNVTINCNYGG